MLSALFSLLDFFRAQLCPQRSEFSEPNPLTPFPLKEGGTEKRGAFPSWRDLNAESVEKRRDSSLRSRMTQRRNDKEKKGAKSNRLRPDKF
jgi:hypothetical protein